MTVRILSLLILIVVIGGCGRGDGESRPTPSGSHSPTPSTSPAPTNTVAKTAVPSATSKPTVEATQAPTATSVVSIEPTTPARIERVALLLPAIELPTIISGIRGCDPRPRFSAGGGGGTVPWPTPVGTSGQDSEISDLELAVFSGVAHRVIEDIANWTDQIEIDAEWINSPDDVRELGWALATSVVRMCEAMRLAPWPEKYDSETAPVANLLMDLSILGREMVSSEQYESGSEYFLRIQSLVARIQELAKNFDGLQLTSVTTGSESIGFFVAVPSGWHVTKIIGGFRVVGDYESQLALISSSAEQATAETASVNVRALRNVPNSDESKWVTNGELLFPGYSLSESTTDGLTLVSWMDGLMAKVQIRPIDSQIYYVQSVCSENDAVCIKFADEIFEKADYR